MILSTIFLGIATMLIKYFCFTSLLQESHLLENLMSKLIVEVIASPQHNSGKEITLSQVWQLFLGSMWNYENPGYKGKSKFRHSGYIGINVLIIIFDIKNRYSQAYWIKPRGISKSIYLSYCLLWEACRLIL